MKEKRKSDTISRSYDHNYDLPIIDFARCMFRQRNNSPHRVNSFDNFKTCLQSGDNGFTRAAGRSSTYAWGTAWGHRQQGQRQEQNHQHQRITQALQARCHAPLYSYLDHEATQDFNLGRSQACGVQNRCVRLV
jgi:hypothetical protein